MNNEEERLRFQTSLGRSIDRLAEWEARARTTDAMLRHRAMRKRLETVLESHLLSIERQGKVMCHDCRAWIGTDSPSCPECGVLLDACGLYVVMGTWMVPLVFALLFSAVACGILALAFATAHLWVVVGALLLSSPFLFLAVINWVRIAGILTWTQRTRRLRRS